MKKLTPLFLLIILLSSCHVGRFFIWNFADIHDYKKFPKTELKKENIPFHFYEPVAGNATVRIPKEITEKKRKYTFEQYLHHTTTVAFLVIRNDSLLYEKYLDKYDASSIVPSFSMAKSFVSILMGIAIDEGYVHDVHEPITRYLPMLDEKKFGGITIENVLDMESGVAFKESYFNPFGDVAKYYYGRNLKRYVSKLKLKGSPGIAFDYKSVNTQLLAMIIENATGKPLATYMQEKLWSKLGMEYDASWSLDSKKDKEVKAFCCLNARARDFAKLGRLYLHKGNWNGTQIVSEKWVNQSLNFDRVKNGFMYSYQWWHSPIYLPLADSSKVNGLHTIVRGKDQHGKPADILAKPGKDFYAQGFLGQYVYVYPEKNIIIVRLGHKEKGKISWPKMCRTIAENN
ncbi:serine hydrolase domain-containing protein [Chitinophagaceae bacterium MMS25-I14]